MLRLVQVKAEDGPQIPQAGVCSPHDSICSLPIVCAGLSRPKNECRKGHKSSSVLGALLLRLCSFGGFWSFMSVERRREEVVSDEMGIQFVASCNIVEHLGRTTLSIAGEGQVQQQMHHLWGCLFCQWSLQGVNR